jgi:ribosome-associated toxin RatA of RatAB toxin-antitoxin module
MQPPYRVRGLRGTSLAAALAFLTIGAASAADEVAVTAERDGDGVAIVARATIRSPLTVIWRTLTDYDHLADFIPGMKASRVLWRRGNRAAVEQTGEASFLLFRFPIRVVVEADEHYPAQIGVRVLSGNLRRLAGAYRIDAIAGAAGEYRLQWRGVVEPDTALPLFITAFAVRESVADQFRGMVNEIERRSEAAR